MYNNKKATTSSNFYKPSNRCAIQVPNTQNIKQIVTIEQYFDEMEKKRSCSLSQYTGKRNVSTALPACRQYKATKERPSDHRAEKEYSLGPVQLTKAYYRSKMGIKLNNPSLLQYGNPMKTADQSTAMDARVEEIRLEQQTYHNSRPESRYNKDSMCCSLDGIYNLPSKAITLTNWNKDKLVSKHKSFFNCTNIGENTKWQTHVSRPRNNHN